MRDLVSPDRNEVAFGSAVVIRIEIGPQKNQPIVLLAIQDIGLHDAQALMRIWSELGLIQCKRLRCHPYNSLAGIFVAAEVVRSTLYGPNPPLLHFDPT